MAEEPAGGKIAAEAEEAKGAAAEKKKKDESLRKKIPPTKVLAQVAATLTATFLLSLAGKTGTFAGLIGGSALSSVLPTSYDHFLGKGTKAVKARYRELRLTNMEPEAAMRQARRESRQRFLDPVHWKVLGASFAVIILGTSIAIAVTEAAAREPVSDLVTGKAGTGSTFTGGHTVTVTPDPVYVPVPVTPSFTPFSRPYSPPSFTEPRPLPRSSSPSPSAVPSQSFTPPPVPTSAPVASASPSAPASTAPVTTPPSGPTVTPPAPAPSPSASLPVLSSPALSSPAASASATR